MRKLWYNKNKICKKKKNNNNNNKKKTGKLNQPVKRVGIGSTLGEMALEGVTMHAIPWLDKKTVEMG